MYNCDYNCTNVLKCFRYGIFSFNLSVVGEINRRILIGQASCQYFVSLREQKTVSSCAAPLHAYFFIKMLQQCGFKYLSHTDIWKRIRTSDNWVFSVLCLDSKCSRLLRIKHTDAYSMCAVLYNNSAVLQCPVVQAGCGGRGRCWLKPFPLQVDLDFDPCSTQILRPPAAGRTWTCCV